MQATSRYLVLALFTVAFLCMGSRAAPAVETPQVTERLKAPLPYPYDSNADAGAQIAGAIARAKARGKFVLLDFGGNWCADCRVLAGALGLAEVRPAIDRTFEVVMIDVGRMNKNLDLASRYRVEISAVPTIVILDSRGRVLNAGNPSALSDARTMSPQAIVDTIFGWVRSPG